MFVQVLLPLRLDWIPAYSVPDSPEPGRRVRVRFAGREYVGVIWKTDIVPDVEESRVLPISGYADEHPAISPEELRFWSFLAEYYLCSPGEVYKTACPVSKIRSEQTAAGAARRVEDRHKRLLEAALHRVERLEERLAAKREAIAKAHEGTKARAALVEGEAKILRELDAARRSADAIAAETSAAAPEQIKPAVALDAPGKPVLLLSYQRTGRYLDLVREALSAGGQALVLVPEKSRCKPLHDAFASELGEDRLMICTSDVSAAGRRREADSVREGSPCAIIGTRTAVFLPFKGLHTIIIDDEQDTSYKQTDSAPTFNARDAAVALAGIHGARVVLGSACPSLETVLNVKSGKFGVLPALPGTPLCPEPQIIDVAAERRKNGMVGCISRVLVKAAASSPGPVVLIRGWEKPEELAETLAGLFPGRNDICPMTLPEFRRSSGPAPALLAVLQADALFARDDFRADERASQLVSQLCSLAPQVLVQTAVPDRFRAIRSTDDLLTERKSFGLPPYSRAVDAIFTDSSEKRLGFMKDKLSRRLPGGLVMPDRIRWNIARGPHFAADRKAVRSAVAALEKEFRYTGHIVLDVDPLV